MNPFLKPSPDTAKEALGFLGQMATETTVCQNSRTKAVKHEIEQNGTWDLNDEDPLFATKFAWRNNGRCIGRPYRENLVVYDVLDNEADVAKAAIVHVEIAYDNGKLMPVCTLFKPKAINEASDLRLWNHHFQEALNFGQILTG